MISNIANLVAEYVAAKAASDLAAKNVDRLKKIIKETGMETLLGDHAVLVVGLSERTTLDSALVKHFLTQDQILQASKTSQIESIRIKVTA